MLSRNSLNMSVVLVTAYFCVNVFEECVSREHRDISMIINHIDSGLLDEIVGLESYLKEKCRRKESLKKYITQYEEEKEFLNLLRSHPALASTTKGRQILAVYGLSSADLMQPKSIENLDVHRVVIERLSQLTSLIDKEIAIEPPLINPLIVPKKLKTDYLPGDEYNIEFQVISKLQQTPDLILYDIGHGLDTIHQIPMIFKNKPEKLSIEFSLENQVTGETQRYNRRIIP